MGLFDIFKKQFIDVIEWTEEDAGVLAYRFPMKDREIQNGAQLTVRDTQIALLVNEGQIADIFEPGRHTLSTPNLPILTNLKHWDKGFKSPFTSDLFFFSTREQLNQKWGTPAPVAIDDKNLGPLRLRAHGTYSYRVRNPKVFFRRVSATEREFTTQEMEGQLRAAILTNLATFLGNLKINFVEMSSKQSEFSQILKSGLEGLFFDYGLSLESFFVQSVSLPEESNKKLDNSSPLEVVERLHEMLKKGVITQDDFERKKSELLKRIT